MIYLSMVFDTIGDGVIKNLWCGAGDIDGFESEPQLQRQDYLINSGKSLSFDKYLFFFTDYRLKNFSQLYAQKFLNGAVLVFDSNRHLMVVSHWMHKNQIPHQLRNESEWPQNVTEPPFFNSARQRVYPPTIPDASNHTQPETPKKEKKETVVQLSLF